MEQVIALITDNKEIAIGIGVFILEMILRLVPTEKRGSILSWLGKLSFLLSDILSKVVPDRRKVE